MRAPQPLPLGITMGCPVGVGPEITLKLLAAPGADLTRPAVVLGDPGVLERTARLLGLSVSLKEWTPGAKVAPAVINVLPCSYLPPDLLWGRPDIRTGAAMASCIETAARLTLEGELAGIVTCPITKSALHAAGYRYPGHTEMLADLCGVDRFSMMMAGDRLKVTLVTIHTALSAVSARLTSEAVLECITITGQSLVRDFGQARPRIAVAGVNPHAGEGGLFGDEEARVIAPAVTRAREQGWDASGPLPPDTVFHRAAAGAFDAVVAMYHDQGLIPFKLLHFEDGVNVTLGLPLVRTSVDHGTAYDIAGKGVASERSLRAAFRLAATIVHHRGAANGASHG